MQGVVGDLSYESTPKEQAMFASAQAQLRERERVHKIGKLALRRKERKRERVERESRDSIYLNRVFA